MNHKNSILFSFFGMLVVFTVNHYTSESLPFGERIEELEAATVFGDTSQSGWCFPVVACADTACDLPMPGLRLNEHCGKKKIDKDLQECNGIYGNQYCTTSEPNDAVCYDEHYCKGVQRNLQVVCEGHGPKHGVKMNYIPGDCTQGR